MEKHILQLILHLGKYVEMENPSEKDSFFNRFTATRERSRGFRFFVIFLVLVISIFMMARFAYYMIN